MNTINEVVKNRLCVSCGACGYYVQNRELILRYNKKYYLEVPCIDIESEEAFNICPGKGYDISELGKKSSDTTNSYDVDLGFVDYAWAVHSNNSKILENASSGGIMTEIAYFLLESKFVNGVISTKYIYSNAGPVPYSFIATSLDELIECQGSKYLPVNHENVLKEAKKFNGKLAYIGTPCQIAAVKMLQEKDVQLKNKIVFTIGNFCGGVKDFRELKKQIVRHGFIPKKVTNFRFRGGGQPGSMMIKDKSGKQITHNYPDYNNMTGYTKLKRCLLCVDATAEIADFACGDAWLNKYKHNSKPWSVLITRNSKSTSIIKQMIAEGVINTESISFDEIKLSQKSNLTTKKYRQFSRLSLYRKLGIKVPELLNGYHETDLNTFFEFKVFLSHLFLETLEDLRLFPIILLKNNLLFDIRNKIKKIITLSFLRKN